MWFERAKNRAPEDRLILVTNGIIWRHEEKPRVDWNGKPYSYGPATYTVLKELGGAALVYWVPPRDPPGKNDPLGNKGYWSVFGESYYASGIQNFTYWMHYENPIVIEEPQGSLDVIVPNVLDLPVYQPSEDELRNRKIMSMLGG